MRDYCDFRVSARPRGIVKTDLLTGEGTDDIHVVSDVTLVDNPDGYCCVVSVGIYADECAKDGYFDYPPSTIERVYLATCKECAELYGDSVDDYMKLRSQIPDVLEFLENVFEQATGRSVFQHG